MIEESLFFIWIGWYLYTYGPPVVVIDWLIAFYQFYDRFFNWYNMMIYPDYWSDNDDSVVNETPEVTPKKYEDKYIEDLRKMPKEWIWMPDKLSSECLRLKDDIIVSDLECICKLESELHELTMVDKYSEYSPIHNESETDEEQNKSEENNSEENNSEEDNGYEHVGNREMIVAEQRKIVEERAARISVLSKEIEEMREEMKSDTYLTRVLKLAEEDAAQQFLRERLDSLVHSYVMETTPAGNVIMMYDKSRESFVYYADHNMPYRFLEVVGRKYVKLYQCRPLFVDMEEELKMFEEKWEAAKKKQIEEEEKTAKDQVTKKAPVFAKFKSYNKSAGGNISAASVPNKGNTIQSRQPETAEDAKHLLKERANRYTYIGKIANFSFLQKVERKVFNQKLGFSYADFKKMKQK